MLARATDSEIPSVVSLSRAKHSCAALSPGRVLVAGGVDEAGVVLDSVGVFDVENGTWHEMPSMNQESSPYTHYGL